MKILWVEDHDRFVRIAGAQFLSAHDVTRVATLAEARSALQSEKFELILLDYDLPDGDGDELFAELGVNQATPVIGTSSHEAGNAALKAAGACEVCSKLRFQLVPAILASLDLKTS